MQEPPISRTTPQHVVIRLVRTAESYISRPSQPNTTSEPRARISPPRRTARLPPPLSQRQPTGALRSENLGPRKRDDVVCRSPPRSPNVRSSSSGDQISNRKFRGGAPSQRRGGRETHVFRSRQPRTLGRGDGLGLGGCARKGRNVVPVKCGRGLELLTLQPEL